MESLIKLHNITKIFHEGEHHLTVLEDINLNVKRGEFLILLGPSGSGKSTLLRIMSGLMEPTKGEVSFSKDLTKTFVFQDFALFPWLTVLDNVEYGLKMSGMKNEESKKIARQEIDRMGLTGFEKSFPRELSGGMKQRVGIARSLALRPEIIFLDEPFSALDSFTTKKLRAEILDIWQERKLTLVMVTHSIEEAIELGDRIAVLSNRPAHIDRLFENILPRPRDHRSQKFFDLSDTIADVIKI